MSGSTTGCLTKAFANKTNSEFGFINKHISKCQNCLSDVRQNFPFMQFSTEA